jgi:hypothetical protein
MEVPRKTVVRIARPILLACADSIEPAGADIVYLRIIENDWETTVDQLAWRHRRARNSRPDSEQWSNGLIISPFFWRPCDLELQGHHLLPLTCAVVVFSFPCRRMCSLVEKKLRQLRRF